MLLGQAIISAREMDPAEASVLIARVEAEGISRLDVGRGTSCAIALKSRQLVSSPAITAIGPKRLNFDLICKLFSCAFEVPLNIADGFEPGGSSSLRRCLDSIFEFHIGDEFWQLILSGETSPRFPGALKSLVLRRTHHRLFSRHLRKGL
jgi:hypothetical protein